MRIFFTLVALILLQSPNPSQAQSFDDAVRGNLALALKLCLSGQPSMEAWAQTFYAAGFTGRVDRATGNSDTTHYLSAPADTVQVELYYGEMPEYCQVSSQHLGVGDAATILDLVAPQMRPGYRRGAQPSTNGGAACVTYEDPTNPIGEIVGVISQAQLACAEDGTVLFYISYRV
ncbi:MAG: hypothetical protein AAF748_10040 [Pseudomonadota bacterium]